jgi:hypothetical protein
MIFVQGPWTAVYQFKIIGADLRTVYCPWELGLYPCPSSSAYSLIGLAALVYVDSIPDMLFSEVCALAYILPHYSSTSSFVFQLFVVFTVVSTLSWLHFSPHSILGILFCWIKYTRVSFHNISPSHPLSPNYSSSFYWRFCTNLIRSSSTLCPEHSFILALVPTCHPSISSFVSQIFWGRLYATLTGSSPLIMYLHHHIVVSSIFPHIALSLFLLLSLMAPQLSPYHHH